MGSTAPNVQSLTARAPAVAGGSDATSNVGEAPFPGTVTEVSYIPDATITGAATNNRTLNLINKGSDGTGSTVIATLQFVNGVNIAASDEGLLTLSATPANLNVNQDDVLALQSLHVGTGIADPGGLVEVEISRTSTQ
jgi:hypothetical protein